MRPSAYQALKVFLIFLLLSNSTLALENIVHASHQHADLQQVDSMPGAHADHNMTSPLPAMDQGDGDCICDEICCLGSVDFGSMSAEDTHPLSDTNTRANLALYQSISLDLLLPPPTQALFSFI